MPWKLHRSDPLRYVLIHQVHQLGQNLGGKIDNERDQWPIRLGPVPHLYGVLPASLRRCVLVGADYKEYPD